MEESMTRIRFSSRVIISCMRASLIWQPPIKWQLVMRIYSPFLGCCDASKWLQSPVADTIVKIFFSTSEALSILRQFIEMYGEKLPIVINQSMTVSMGKHYFYIGAKNWKVLPANTKSTRLAPHSPVIACIIYVTQTQTDTLSSAFFFFLFSFLSNVMLYVWVL